MARTPARDGPHRNRLTELRHRLGDLSALSPQARSTGRLALVAGTVLVIVAALFVVTLHARAADRALDDATTRTLRDYTGYAGRLMGSEMLRRFAEQRGRILAPVTGSVEGPGAPPALSEIVRRGQREFDTTAFDPGRVYLRLDLATGATERVGPATAPLVTRAIDTLRALARRGKLSAEPDLVVLEDEQVPYSVAYATLRDRTGRATAVYAYSYTRSIGMAQFARAVFHETPLLPPSFAGLRWNYDTTQVRPGEVLNDALLSVRVTDRTGRLLWASPGVPPPPTTIREFVVISTYAGGLIVETALQAGSVPTLIPSVVRRAQRWSMRAVLALTLMLAAVSLLALRREGAVGRARRGEAMEQLALGIRHELNNALATVLLNAELLGERPELDDVLRERVTAITEQAERMRDVLRRLEHRERLDMIVPYLDAGYMVDLSARGPDRITSERPPES